MRIDLPPGGEHLPPSSWGSAYVPEMGRVAAEFSRVTYARSQLSLREFEAARMVTAYLNGCQLCQNWRSASDIALYFSDPAMAHQGTVADRGLVPDEAFYQAIQSRRSAYYFTARERIAMEMAEGMGERPKTLAEDEDFWRRAKSVFSDRDLVDLSYCLAVWIGLGRMTHVLGLDGLCAMPKQRPA